MHNSLDSDSRGLSVCGAQVIYLTSFVPFQLIDFVQKNCVFVIASDSEHRSLPHLVSNAWQIVLSALTSLPCNLPVAYSTVTQSRSYLPDVVGAVTWIAPYAPHHSSFVPVYASATVTPSSLNCGTQCKATTGCIQYNYMYSSGVAWGLNVPVSSNYWYFSSFLFLRRQIR